MFAMFALRYVSLPIEDESHIILPYWPQRIGARRRARAGQGNDGARGGRLPVLRCAMPAAGPGNGRTQSGQ